MLANKTIYVMQDIKYHCLGDLQRELLCERDNRNGNKRRSAKVEVGKQLYGHKYDYAKQTA